MRRGHPHRRRRRGAACLPAGGGRSDPQPAHRGARTGPSRGQGGAQAVVALRVATAAAQPGAGAAVSGRNLATISAVDSVQLYGSQIAGDYVRWSAGHVLAEATERLVSEEMEPARPQYRLLVSGLAALADEQRDPRLVIDAFLLRSLATGGWAPSFADCAQCGATGPHPWIHLASGGAVCEDCRPAGAVSISPATSRAAGGAAQRGLAGRRARPARPPGEPLPGWWPRICNCTSSVICGRCPSRTRHGCRNCRSNSPRNRMWSRERIPAPAPQWCHAAAADRRSGPAARRDGHGRQRPLGAGAGLAPYGRSRGGRGEPAGLRARCAGAGRHRGCRRTRSAPRTGGARRTRCASSWGSTAT